jgi:hypothetical protein
MMGQFLYSDWVYEDVQCSIPCPYIRIHPPSLAPLIAQLLAASSLPL